MVSNICLSSFQLSVQVNHLCSDSRSDTTNAGQYEILILYSAAKTVQYFELFFQASSLRWNILLHVILLKQGHLYRNQTYITFRAFYKRCCWKVMDTHFICPLFHICKNVIGFFKLCNRCLILYINGFWFFHMQFPQPIQSMLQSHHISMWRLENIPHNTVFSSTLF